jgi:hypothetical protein
MGKKKKLPIHHRIRHHIVRFHKLRKHKETSLPKWKRKWSDFNEKHFLWLEKAVDQFIPWLVLALLVIIFGEFSHYINVFHWQWPEKVALFFEEHDTDVMFLDKVIVTFFIIDLYFNFFKKKTVWSFIKTSFLDILAIAPLGLIFRVAEIGEAQSALHVGAEFEKEAAKASRVAKEVSKIPRFFRLNRLTHFFVKRKKKKH